MAPTEQPAVVPARDRPSIGLLVAVGAVVALARWLVARERTVFHINPDEPGQLAMARYIAGVTRWNMFDHITWRPGYALLLAPIERLVDDPVTSFRAALAVNALLGGMSAVLLVLLARRLTPMSNRWCAFAALVASLAPAILFTTVFVWSEALTQTLCLATVLVCLLFVDRASAWRGAVAIALAVAAFTSHSRMFPLILSVVGLIWFSAWQRTIAVRTGIVLTVFAGLATGASMALAKVVVAGVWEDPQDTNTFSAVLSQMTRPWAVVVAAIGQVWYQLVATAGIVGIGAIVTARSALRRGEGDRPRTRDARVLVVVLGPLIALSMIFMASRWRPDQAVYGRYNDAVVLPILLVGIGALVAAVDRRRLLRDHVTIGIVAIACALALVWLRGDDLADTDSVRSMVLGIQGFMRSDGSIDVLHITVVGTVAGAAVAVVALLRSYLARSIALGGLLVLLLAVAGVRTRDVVDVSLNSWASADAVRELDGTVIPPGVPVRYRFVRDTESSARWSDQRHRSQLYQYFLPDHAMYVDGTEPADVDTPYVFGPVADPDLLARGAQMVWRDPGAPIALWIEPPD